MTTARIVTVVDGVPGYYENRPLGEFESFDDAKEHIIAEAAAKYPGRKVAAMLVIDEELLPPLTTKTLIWQNRLVKMLDPVTWAFSRVGDHNDFDFFPEIVNDDIPIAGNFECLPVTDFEVVDEYWLHFKTNCGGYFLRHDPKGGWLISRQIPIEWRGAGDPQPDHIITK
jgi:hypothetical protein